MGIGLRFYGAVNERMSHLRLAEEGFLLDRIICISSREDIDPLTEDVAIRCVWPSRERSSDIGGPYSVKSFHAAINRYARGRRLEVHDFIILSRFSDLTRGQLCALRATPLGGVSSIQIHDFRAFAMRMARAAGHNAVHAVSEAESSVLAMLPANSGDPIVMHDILHLLALDLKHFPLRSQFHCLMGS